MPQPHEKWTEVRETKAFGDRGIQKDNIFHEFLETDLTILNFKTYSFEKVSHIVIFGRKTIGRKKKYYSLALNIFPFDEILFQSCHE